VSIARRNCEPGDSKRGRLTAAARAAAHVPDQLAPLAQDAHALGDLGHHSLHALAPLARLDRHVLAFKAAAGAEQHALDSGLGKPHPLADLVVGAALELSHDERVVLRRGEAVEGLRQVRELLLLRVRPVGVLIVNDDPLVGRGELVPAVDQLVLAAAATHLVQAGVPGDLVQPCPESGGVRERAEAVVRG
jgi:hypothetical protein